MFRRALQMLFSLFVLAAVLAPLPAHAKWITDEVGWRISSIGPTGSSTGIWVRDTMRTSIGPVDTTSSFSLDEAWVPPRGVGMPAGVATTSNGALASTDTCTVAWLVISPDTSVDLTPALTSATCFIDGRVGGFGVGTPVTNGYGWVKADSSLVNGAAGGTMILGDDVIAFPIRSISPYGSIWRWSELRARITGLGGATGIPAARVFLRYWIPEKEK